MLVNPLFYAQDIVPVPFYNPQVYEKVTKPKLLRKVESDDEVRFQIFKLGGNFNSFEFKLIKLNEYQGLLEVFSVPDHFKVSVKLNLTKIDLNKIDFEVDPRDSNLLNLIIPKYTQRYYEPQDVFGQYLENFLDQLTCENSYVDKEQLRKEALRKSEAEKEKQRRAREQQKQEQLRREQERREQERREQERREQLRREQERREQERREQLRREQERREQLGKEQEKQERIKREKEARLRKVREEKLRKEREEGQKQAQELMNQFIESFFGAQQFPQAFSPFGFPLGESQSQAKKPAKEPVSKSEEPEVSAPAAEVVASEPDAEPEVETPESEPDTPLSPEVEMEDTESINSDVPTPDTPLSTLHKHPSIEEVEDEEFVMLRKKFGQ